MTTVPTPSRTAKAIETRYAGCRFRSRLEARWAVFFDTLGIRWEYEPEGFELPSGRYLPDFLLPDLDTWFEVKGQAPNVRERTAAFELAAESRRRVVIAFGPIKRDAGAKGYCCNHGPTRIIGPGFEVRRFATDAAGNLATFGNGMPITASDGYCGDGAMIYAYTPGEAALSVAPDSDYAFCVCPWCGRLGLEYEARGARVCGWQAHHVTEAEALAAVEPAGHWRADDKCYTGSDPRIVEAYRAARSARFEHGESGR